MSKKLTIINLLFATYFFVLANIFFWSTFLALFLGEFTNLHSVSSPLSILCNLIIAPILIYGSVSYLRDFSGKYLLGSMILLFVLVEIEYFRLKYLNGFILDGADVTYICIFCVPIIINLLIEKDSVKKLNINRKKSLRRTRRK